ncbi:MAG: hypothetical protein AAGF12_16470 [Myxococcota bacterium]
MPAPTPVLPLGTDVLMPALLLGYESDIGPESPRWTRRKDAKPWLFFVEQQAGGYCMSYPTALGILFRLHTNAPRAVKPPETLIQAFHAMAEDPEPKLVKKLEPRLFEACGTWGSDYSTEVLAQISDAMRDYFEVPRCTGGLEAFVRLEPSPTAFRSVLGWHYVVPSGSSKGVGEDWLSEGPQWFDGPPMTGSDVATLEALASDVLGVTDKPALFLLWENSD